LVEDSASGLACTKGFERAGQAVFMTPQTFLREVIDPGTDRLFALGGPPSPPEAKRLLLAIALQESGRALAARYQNSPSPTPGPAKGYFQFESNGGVHGVLNHPASAEHARNLCAACNVVAHPAAVWRALEGHDILAAAFARLLLWTDRQPLPTTQQGGWEYYLRNWRPGRPHPQNWAGNWTLAEATLATGV
jgi:hypothetical protein